MIYTVRDNETIIDVILNGTGNLSAWEAILNLNQCDTWTPEFKSGQQIEVGEIINKTIADELRLSHLTNFSLFNIDTLIADLTTILDSVTVETFKTPTTEQNKVVYIVKEGETITDVVLNSTGSLDNWQTILSVNGFTDWSPTLQTGQEIVIEYLELQQNVLLDLNISPLCNDSGINDLDTQITDLIAKFADTVLFDDDLVVVEFDDDLTEALFN